MFSGQHTGATCCGVRIHPKPVKQQGHRVRKKKERSQVAVRRAECARGGGGDRPPKSLRREWQKKDRRFKGAWCTWDPAVRTSDALAFAAQVSDRKSC